MPTSCSIINCCSRQGRDIKKFYRLPCVIKYQGDLTKGKSERRRRLWISAINLNRSEFGLNTVEKPPDYFRVCSNHFITGKPATLYDETNPDWFPTLKLRYHPSTSTINPDHGYACLENRIRMKNMKDKAVTFIDTSSLILEKNDLPSLNSIPKLNKEIANLPVKMSTSFVKIETTLKKSCYLLTELKDGGKEGFKLTITDGEHVWGGELTEDDLDNLCTKIKMDFETYVKQTVKAFTLQDVGDLSFEYQMKPHTDDTVNFIWKKYVPADDIRFQMGSVSLYKKAEPTKFICKIFTHCIDNIGQLQTQIHSLETDNERLSQERTMALKRLDKCVTAKEEVEKDLYSKFVAVLNSKKEKIRNLKRNSEGDEIHSDENEEVDPPLITAAPALADDDDSADEHSANIQNTARRKGSEGENTDDERSSTPKRQKKAPTRKKQYHPDNSLVLEDDTDVQTTAVVTRPARRAAGRKKQTPSKPVLPKVTSKSSDSSGSSTRRHSLRKSASNSSNRSSDNIEPEDLLGDL